MQHSMAFSQSAWSLELYYSLKILKNVLWRDSFLLYAKINASGIFWNSGSVNSFCYKGRIKKNSSCFILSGVKVIYGSKYICFKSYDELCTDFSFFNCIFCRSGHFTEYFNETKFITISFKIWIKNNAKKIIV